MAILLLLTCFALLFFSIGICKKNAAKKKELVLNTVLIFCGLIVLITELLSLFNALNFRTILFSWLLFNGLNLLYLYLKKDRVKVFYNTLKVELNETYLSIKARKPYERFLLISVLIILLLVFVQSIIYPPNNADSMTYHLARIPSWISHQSVAHYPSGVVRQIYQPPFAEYVIMHFNILSRTDLFSGMVQFSFLLFSIVALLAITETFCLSISYKILAIFLVLTIPEVVLQAGSTQNDLVVSFFVIVSFYFAIKSIKEFNVKNASYFGLAVGLGILTKATAYMYIFPIILIFGITVLIRLFSTKNYNYIWYSLLAAFIFLLINFNFYYRNYKLTSNLLGVDSKEYNSYSNEKMNAKLLASSIIKNVGNHVGLLHLKPLSVVTANSIKKLHKLAGININDPANNYFQDIPYNTLYFPAHQDLAPNFIHLILITISIITIIVQIFKGRANLVVKILALTVIFQGIFFCFYLKYQPYHTRLHTPMFLLSVPLICYSISIINNSYKKLFYGLTPAIWAYALMIVFSNMNMPYNSTITESRYQKYFISKVFLYDEYNLINKAIKEAGYKKIGLIMEDEAWEYTLFTDCYKNAIAPVYLNVNNYTKNSKTTSNQVDCIVTSVKNEPFLDYKGKRFYNQNLKNRFIHLYR